MPFEADPYRTLGLAPGASLNEIRSAYRRLAKQYHPDAAGDRALSRFLAIQAAYERLVDGDGRLRKSGDGTAQGDVRGTAREPWRADAARARASREAWRTRRGGGAGTGGRARPEDGARPGDRRAGGEPHHRRHVRRATPGSTSYDEAAETPLDPAWDGGDWYGPNSGTYWTINPREYADPRKHGPEYLARARRAAGLAEDDDDEDRVDDRVDAGPPARAAPTRPAAPSAVSASLAAIAVGVLVAVGLALVALPRTGVEGDTILIGILAVTWVVALVAVVVRRAGARKPPA